MSEELLGIIVIVVVIAIIAAVFRGAINTFRRNWLAALALLILFFPLWVIWAFVEIFLDDPDAKKSGPSQISENDKNTLIRGEEARIAIMNSGNQELINRLRLIDAAGAQGAGAMNSSIAESSRPSGFSRLGMLAGGALLGNALSDQSALSSEEQSLLAYVEDASLVHQRLDPSGLHAAITDGADDAEDDFDV